MILPITAFYIRAPGSVGYERAAFTALSLDVLLTGALPARRAPPATPGVHTCPPHDPPPGDSAPPGRASRYTNRDASLYDYTRIMRNTTAGEVASRLDLASSLDRPHELESRGEHELVPLAAEHRDTMLVHVARREGGHDVPARARGARALSSTPRRGRKRWTAAAAARGSRAQVAGLGFQDPVWSERLRARCSSVCSRESYRLRGFLSTGRRGRASSQCLDGRGRRRARPMRTFPRSRPASPE